MIFSKLNLYHKVIAVLLVLLLFSLAGSRYLFNRWKAKEDTLHGEIVRNQKVIKEKDGVYLRMVNQYDQTKDSLISKLKKVDAKLAKSIKKNKEDILMYENIILSFKPITDTVFLTDTILSDYSKVFTFYYPEKFAWFIKLRGGIRNDSVFGSWKFGNLPISLILSENKDGSWNRRLIGPEWLKVSEITVNSILKTTEQTKKNLFFPVGVGYTFFSNTRMINLYGGISYKRFSVMSNISFESQLGIGLGINSFFMF